MADEAMEAGASPRPALLSSLPLWVQAVSLVGFPVFVAGFYMLKDIGYLPSVAEVNAKSIQEILLQHKGQTDLMVESVRLQRVACFRAATSPSQHRECIE